MPDHGLSQALSQKQIISTQMQQSLQLLQASALELQQLAAQEMEINPVLELDQETPDESEDKDADSDDETLADDDAPTEQEWDDYWADGSRTGSRIEGDEKRYDHAMESITGVRSLTEFLREQLHLWPDHTPAAAEYVELLIGQLDERGFLTRPLAGIAEESGTPLEELTKAHDVLLTFDPPGIGAADLRHSLLLQLDRQGKKKQLAWTILSDHFDALAARRLPAIAEALDVEIEDVAKAAHVIATLDPAPGLKFETTEDRYITTDVIIEREGDSWKATLTAEDVPRLRISKAYRDMLAEGSSKDAREYLREKIKSGKQFIATIAQRQDTIRRIAEEIIKRQPEFFEHGRTHLRPLTMAPIAQELGVHETTISRAVAGKYLRTPHGLMELRSFFTSGIATEGADLSNTSVKETLHGIIRGENTREPYSDDRLAQLLEERGIHVARRTVAKYREELGVLSSQMRRTYAS